MAAKFSTGLRNKMLDTSSFDTIMALGFIKIYAGTVPATADASIGSATLLCTISVDGTGTGITMAASAASGVLLKNASETWEGTNVATGTATFYRHVAVGDTGASSTTEARIQGTVAVAGADMSIDDVDLTNGAPQSLDYYAVALPTL